MISVLQRVSQASVVVDGEVLGQIGRGILMLVCAEPGDTTEEADRLLAKVLKLRIFPDEAGRMNRSLQDLDGGGERGGLLVISQFTLAADLSSGNRPGFAGAAEPVLARELLDHLLTRARAQHAPVATGRFGADMKVHLINDGPVTLPLRIVPRAAKPQ